MSGYSRNVIGNEYLNPRIDERFVVTDLQDWGMDFNIMLMLYEDNVDWDEPVTFLDDCELIREGDLPISMGFFTEEGAKSRARSFGFSFAWTLEHESDIEEATSEMELAEKFRNYIRSDSLTDDDCGKTLSEVLADFEESVLDTDDVMESIWAGFVESLSESYMYDLPSDKEEEASREHALA